MTEQLPLGELKTRLAVEGLTDELRALLESDERAGAAALLKSAKAKLERERKQLEHMELLLKNERRVWANGYSAIAGLDEVGRGPLAGPVTVGLVILPVGLIIPGVDDSKKLSEAKRTELAPIIREKALFATTSSLTPQQIDEIGIYNAVVRAMHNCIESAIASLTPPDYLFVDAVKLKGINLPSESIIHGDALSQTIAAASIIAKVERDAYMVELGEKYPEYDFAGNKGYGTAAHMDAIRRYGLSPEHRRSFCGGIV